MDDRDSRVWTVFAKVLFGKVFADRGYIKQELVESLFSQDIQLVHGFKAKMNNELMPMWDKIMLRKRYIIECINNGSLKFEILATQLSSASQRVL